MITGHTVLTSTAVQGYAIKADGTYPTSSLTLDPTPPTTVQGSSGGLWPVTFTSSGNAFGQDPTKVYGRILYDQQNNGSIEVFVFPDPAGDTKTTHFVFCLMEKYTTVAIADDQLGSVEHWSTSLSSNSVDDVLLEMLSSAFEVPIDSKCVSLNEMSRFHIFTFHIFTLHI